MGLKIDNTYMQLTICSPIEHLVSLVIDSIRIVMVISDELIGKRLNGGNLLFLCVDGTVKILVFLHQGFYALSTISLNNASVLHHFKLVTFKSILRYLTKWDWILIRWSSLKTGFKVFLRPWKPFFWH